MLVSTRKTICPRPATERTIDPESSPGKGKARGEHLWLDIARSLSRSTTLPRTSLTCFIYAVQKTANSFRYATTLTPGASEPTIVPLKVNASLWDIER